MSQTFAELRVLPGRSDGPRLLLLLLMVMLMLIVAILAIYIFLFIASLVVKSSEFIAHILCLLGLVLRSVEVSWT